MRSDYTLNRGVVIPSVGTFALHMAAEVTAPVAIATDSGWMTAHPEVETDGRGGATMILPGETEAGSAGMQPCRGGTLREYLRTARRGRASSVPLGRAFLHLDRSG
jgi:hypothetical protein